MIEYIQGDLFDNLPETHCVIPHIVNNRGGWGKGFVVPLGQRFPKAEQVYREWFGQPDFKLGNNKWYRENNVYIVHMLAQRGYKSWSNPIPLDYYALELCMKNVSEKVITDPIYTVKFGAGLAGGDWDRIENMIKSIWSNRKVFIFEKD